MAEAGSMAGPIVVNLIGGSGRAPEPVLGEEALDVLRAAGLRVRDRPAPPGMAAADLPGWIGEDAWGVLTSWGSPTYTPEVLDALPNLRCIGYVAGSVKRLVTVEAFARGVVVLTAAPVIARAVAEYCLAAALWTRRRLGDTAEALAAAPGPVGWAGARRVVGARSLVGESVGIVSASSTGRRFIELLAPFGCQVSVYDPYLEEDDARRMGVRRAALDEVCAQPIVSVHAPNLPATKGLLGATQLARIPDGGLLINSARGDVVDMPALVEALASGRIHAMLDVFPEEPLPAGHPLYGMPNVVLTPHVAGYSADTRRAMGIAICADIVRLHRGQTPECAVDGRRWDLLGVG